MTKHMHGEAFMLMKYRADDGSEEEVVWNSRDGVTPFVITLRSGKQATHVDWNRDVYAPDYVPPLGSRVFINLTNDRARALHAAQVDTLWDHPQYPMREAFETKTDAINALTRDVQPGEPDIIEVREPWTGGFLVEQPAQKEEE